MRWLGDPDHRTFLSLPPLLAVVVLVPLLAAVAMSFTSQAPGGEYLRYWGTTRGWEALARTLRLAATAAVIAMPLGYALVVTAGRCGPTWTLAAVTTSCSAMLIPASLVATAWTILAAPTHPIGAMITRRWPNFTMHAFPVAAAAGALRYFGLVAAAVWLGQLRQAKADPAERAFEVPAMTRWVHLRLRPMLPATVGGGALVMLFCMNDHILPGMFLISTCGTQVMIEYTARMDPAGAVAVAVPMAVVGAGLLWAAGRLVRPTAAATERLSSAAPSAGWAIRVGGAVVSATILAVALAVPVGVLAERTATPAALVEAFHLGRREAAHSLALAIMTAGLCVLLAAPLADHWLRRRGGVAALAVLNLAVPASLPAIVVVVIVALPPLRWLDQTLWPLAFACAARFTPVAMFVLLALWRDENPLADQAAVVHGLSVWRRLRRLTWPRRRLSVLTAGLVCAVLAVTELEMAVMLAPPDGATLAVRLYTMIHTAGEQVVSALTLCLLGLTIVGIALLTGMIALASHRRRRTS